MKKERKLYLKLFAATFSLSAFTFGGGYVIVPLMRKKFVDQYGWLNEKDMLDLTAIAQSSPGAMAVNAAILVGYQTAGVLGSIITILGTVMPPLIILSVISIAYTAFQNSVIVHYVLKGMQAGVAAVVLDVSVSMIRELFKEKAVLPAIVFAGAFLAAFFFNVNVAYVIIVCGLLGALAVVRKKSLKR